MAIFDFFLTKKGSANVKAFKDDAVSRIYLKLFYRNYQSNEKNESNSFSNFTGIHQPKASSTEQLKQLEADNSGVDNLMDKKFKEQIGVNSIDLSANEIHAIIIEVRQEAGLNLFAVFKDRVTHVV